MTDEVLINRRGRLLQVQAVSKQGQLMRLFLVRNSKARVQAIGCLATGDKPGFVNMKSKRRENDLSLVSASEKLTGIPVRRHEWQKGRKGCPKIIRRIAGEVL